MDDIIRPTKAAFRAHKKHENHKLDNSLSDVILGGQDGLVDALGIILGLSAVSSDTRILIAAVLAGVCAEAISMGAVAYTSAVAQQDHYEAERAKEYKEVDEEPHMEREEIRRIYEAKGFSGKVLEEIVETITADREMWVDTMMREELDLHRIDTKSVLKSSVIVGFATFFGGVIPLLPFFYFEHSTGVILAVSMSAIALFAIGAYQAITLVGSWWKTGIRMVIIGLSAAFFGYLIASLFKVSGI
jgi:vacuolar iron transporter family protein